MSARPRAAISAAGSTIKLGLLLLILSLLPGCGQVSVLASRASALVSPTRAATILYTGYGQGRIDPHDVCT